MAEAFNEENETWEHYTERLGHYFEANGVGDVNVGGKPKRLAILLSVCGSKIYKLIRDLLAPAKPGEKSYQDLLKLIQDHLAPKPSEITQSLLSLRTETKENRWQTFWRR